MSDSASPQMTKEELIEKLREIRDRGWIRTARPGNQGGVGNTVEDILGIRENNLPIPNAAEWELKCQRRPRGRAGSYTTLFHMEPSPRAMRLVPSLLLPNYGWQHAEAGAEYPATEMSFRQTINAGGRTDRGFGIVVEHSLRRVAVSFDATAVQAHHRAWLDSVEDRIGLQELSPQPYWGFDDLFHKAGTKLLNCFHLLADVRRMDGVEHFNYATIMMLEGFSLEKFVTAIENGSILVDFDARTGHNHGTKIRLRQGCLPDLYDTATII